MYLCMYVCMYILNEYVCMYVCTSTSFVCILAKRPAHAVSVQDKSVRRTRRSQENSTRPQLDQTGMFANLNAACL